jgi:hypothetical protein
MIALRNNSKSPSGFSRNFTLDHSIETDRSSKINRSSSNKSNLKNGHGGSYTSRNDRNENTPKKLNNVLSVNKLAKMNNKSDSSSVISDISFVSNSVFTSNVSTAKQNLTIGKEGSSTPMTKSNYIFKKDLQNLQKEAEFIQKNRISLDDCEFIKEKNNSFINSAESLRFNAKIKSVDEILERIFKNIQKIKEKSIIQIEEEKKYNDRICDVFSENINTLMKDVNNYNEDVKECILSLILLFSFCNFR